MQNFDLLRERDYYNIRIVNIVKSARPGSSSDLFLPSLYYKHPNSKVVRYQICITLLWWCRIRKLIWIIFAFSSTLSMESSNAFYWIFFIFTHREHSNSESESLDAFIMLVLSELFFFTIGEVMSSNLDCLPEDSNCNELVFFKAHANHVNVD